RIGAYLHICCLVDRLKAGEHSIAYTDKAVFLAGNRTLYNLIRHELQPLADKYDVTFSEDDVCFVMNFFIHNKTLV
ncbi:PRD domain-containing protein, partial [Mesorhizobium sp. M00.F.Ca.ET.186.01.1.1]